MVRQICIMYSDASAYTMQKDPSFSKDHGTHTKQYKHYKSQNSLCHPSGYRQTCLCAQVFDKHHCSSHLRLVISFVWGSVQ